MVEVRSIAQIDWGNVSTIDHSHNVSFSTLLDRLHSPTHNLLILQPSPRSVLFNIPEHDLMIAQAIDPVEVKAICVE